MSYETGIHLDKITEYGEVPVPHRDDDRKAKENLMAAKKRALSIADIRSSFENILSGLHPDLQRNFEYLCQLAEQGQRALTGFTTFKNTVVAALEGAQAPTEDTSTKTKPVLKRKGKRPKAQREQERQAILAFIESHSGVSMDEIQEAIDPKRQKPVHVFRHHLLCLRKAKLIRSKGVASATRYYAIKQRT